MGKQILLMKLSILTVSANFNKTTQFSEKKWTKRVGKKKKVVIETFFFYRRRVSYVTSSKISTFLSSCADIDECVIFYRLCNIAYQCHDQNVSNGYA